MTSTPVLLVLVLTGAVAWLLAAACLVALLAVAVLRAVRVLRRPGRHRATGAVPGGEAS